MELWELTGVRPGITALTGGGGKTTAMYTLARELSRLGGVVCTTTTHIRPPDHLPVLDGGLPALREALRRYGCVCAGAPAAEGKLAAPSLSPAELAAAADYVLVEADGSRGLPVKAHLAYEPAVPGGAGLTLLIVGASAFGRPVREAVHRWERFCALTRSGPEDPVTPENLAGLIEAEALPDMVFVNQAETPEALARARELARLLPRPVCAGALRGGIWECLS